MVLPISIDDDAKSAQPHFVNQGWNHLDTYWTGDNENTGWHAPAMRAFVLNAVPTGVLIDRTGKILWIGHPLSNQGKDLESRIDKALNR